MINIEHIDFISSLIEKKPFDPQNFIFIKQKINEYVYPIGVLELQGIVNNDLYEQASVEDNLNYFTPIIHFLFQDTYTINEQNIIIIFLLINCYSHYILKDELINLIEPIILLSSEKVEIQYCIDEIKYRYILALICSNSNQTELINKITNELKSIEEEHNNLILNQRK